MFRFLLVIVMLWPLSVAVAQDDCSLGGTNAEATITFTNSSDDAVTVYWVNFECEEVSFQVLSPGQSYTQSTFDGHEWVVRNTAGEIVAFVIGNASEPLIVEAGDDSFVPSLEFTYRPSGTFEVITDAECSVTDVPTELGLDPFYTQYCDYNGLPIIADDQVDPQAFEVAWLYLANMLQGHPEVLEVMLENDIRIGIIAEEQGVTDLPEYNFLKDDPNTDWDARSRGFGATFQVPLGSVGEENLLCTTTDPYLGESIFVHEFAHTLKDVGIVSLDPSINSALTTAYNQAMESGLWQDTYAATNMDEYWAEGVQTYFNTNLTSDPPNGIHGPIDTRAELKRYDPALFVIIDTVFAGFEWAPICPT